MRHHSDSRAPAGLILRAASLALLAALLLGACGGGGADGGKPAAEEGEKKDEAVPVEVAAASRRDMAASYTGTAPLEAPAESQVVAKTSGVALRVLVAEGDQVRAGQTLVTLDSDRARLQVAQTAAQLHRLENEYARAKTLAAEQLIAASDYDQIRYDLENARAANRLAKLELSYAEVKSPIDGTVASVSPKPGNFVQINTPIVRVVDVSELEATLNVPERELATLKKGLPVELVVDAVPGQTFSGVVDRVSPVVDSGSGTFRVIAMFDNAGILQPGMFGRIRIRYDQRADALVVPRTALLEDEGGAAVFAVVDNKVVRKEVQVGYLDGQWAEVRAGLAAGERVVVAGKNSVRDGVAVTVVGGGADRPAVPPAGGDAAATAATSD